MRYAILYLIIFFIVSRTVFAEDITVTCEDKKTCSLSSSKPLFSSSEIWFPGKSYSKTVKIKNNSKDSRNIYSRFQKISTTGDVDKALTLSIKKNNIDIWSGSLFDFYKRDALSLGIFKSNDYFNFIYIISMDKSAGNDYQNKNTSFNLVFEFFEEIITSTPTINNILVSSDALSDINQSDPTINQIFVGPTEKGEVKGVKSQKRNKIIFILEVIGIELIVICGYFFVKLIFSKRS